MPGMSTPPASPVLTVLVGEDAGVDALAGLDRVRAVRFDPGAPLPAAAAEATVLVASGAAPARLAALLPSLPAVRLVQTLNAGYEQWKGLLPPHVRLSNGRGAHGGSTAEWAAAALLAVVRDLPAFVRDTAAGSWDWHPTGTLDGARVLIVGAGDLGTELARRLTPFGAEVTFVAHRARPGVHTVDELPALLPAHDAAVLMVPLTDATRQLADAAFLAAMPDGAVLVNAARGAVVDTDALVAELKAGRLRAALDVTDPEPLPAGHPLWDAPGLLLTPHVGGATAGAQDRAWRVAARQIALVADGRDPENLVDPNA